ncbi:PAS domain S-box protein [Desulfurispira natronophila]|uniref:histidine kinase n=1 Tax=Desulfurispira natronophila TaxID=682562 RepID=A0A7W8DFT9_9BACT|nr:PAS domain S-box protein [Desulfurispira natronophila]MBB5020791.1 PAS domain S-box-containing protein [Desulfurispira natronophila]
MRRNFTPSFTTYTYAFGVVILLTTLIWLVMLYLLEQQRDRSIEELLYSLGDAQSITWQSVLNQQRHSVATWFEEYVQENPRTLELMDQARDRNQRDQARAHLYRHLADTYDRLQQRGVRQFHFHLPNGDSLLRFHQLDQYGDNLMDVRYSVKVANEEHRAVMGFETGRIVSGFRSTFPVFSEQGEHLGSVELSLPFDTLRQEMSRLFEQREFEMLLRRELVDGVIFEEQQEIHAPWPASDRLIVEDPQRVLPDAPPALSASSRATVEALSHTGALPCLDGRVENGYFSVQTPDGYQSAIFTCLFDTQGEHSGYLVSYGAFPQQSVIHQTFQRNLVVTTLALLALAVAVLAFLSRHYALGGERQRLQIINDTLGEGLYVMGADGRVTDVNQRACEMLGYDRSQIIGQAAHDLFHSHSENYHIPLQECPFYEAVMAGQEYRQQEIFRRCDGVLITVRVTSRPIRKGSEIVGSVTTFADITRQVETQEALQRSEDFLNAIFESIQDGISVLDRDLSIVRTNRWVQQMYPQSLPLETQKCYGAYQQRETPCTWCPALKTLAEGTPQSQIVPWPGEQEPEGWLEISTYPVFDNEGKVHQVVEFVRDITDRIQVQQELACSEQRFRLFAENSDTVFWVRTADKILYISPAYERVWGHSCDELYENPDAFWQNVHHEDKTRITKALEDDIQGRRPFDEYYRIVRSDNSVRWIHARSFAVSDENQGTGYWTGVAHDVTLQKAHEETLEQFSLDLARKVNNEVARRMETEQSYQALVENSPEGILLMDSECRFVSANPAAARMLMMEPQQLQGLTPLDISPSQQPDGLSSDQKLQQAVERVSQDKVTQLEWTHLDELGDEVLTEVVISKLDRESSGCMLVLWRDITEVRRLQHERQLQEVALTQQSKMAELGNMMGAIAHQWKQPLNNIALHMQYLPELYEDGKLTSEELERATSRIMELLKFMATTIEDFRNFFKPSGDLEAFDLHRSVVDVVEIIKGQLVKDTVTVNIADTPNCRIQGRRGEFQQVVLNILNNAREAIVEQKPLCREIDISFQLDDSFVGVTICDHAGGIPAHLLPDKLFNPFVSTKGQQGTGIGLSLSRSIIEKMNGSVTAHNSDDGACFYIQFPLYREESENE